MKYLFLAKFKITIYHRIHSRYMMTLANYKQCLSNNLTSFYIN